jgi:serine/threonine protein kinase
MPKAAKAYSLPTSRYRTLGLVGRGQFGRVFCARSRKTGEIFALKELEQHRFPTSKFLRELRFLLTLQHPNIVSCYAIEHSRGNRYLVMEYCEAGTLREVLNHGSGLTPLQGIKLIIDTLQGLAHAHQSNIIHCDLKPENVLLKLTVKGWQAKVSDFGVAKLAQEIDDEGHNNTGSPGYMAPERFYGQFSIASDLYAIGVMLYEVLLGRRPFSGNPAELMRAHINQRVHIPDTLPSSLRDVVAKSLEKLPGKRFSSAIAMKEAILTALKSGQVSKAVLSQVLAFASSDPLSSKARSAYAGPIDLDRLGSDAVFKQYLPTPLTELVPLKTLPTAAIEDGNNDVSPEMVPVAVCGAIGHQLWLEPIDANASMQEALVNLAHQLSDQSSVSTINCEQLIEHLTTCRDRLFVFTNNTNRAVYGLTQANQELQLLHHISAAQPELPLLKTVSPYGDWVALAQGSKLELKNLLNDRAFSLDFARDLDTQFPAQASISAQIQISEITAFDRHHLVVLLQQDDRESSQIALVSRRGNLMWQYPLPSRISAAIAHGNNQLSANISNGRLILVEAKTNNLCLVELFPYRVNRLRLDYVPTAIAPIDWGCIIAADLGNGHSNLNLLDLFGHRVGWLTMIGKVIKISPINTYTLLVLTSNSPTDGLGQPDLNADQQRATRHSHVYLINLKQLEVDIIF